MTAYATSAILARVGVGLVVGGIVTALLLWGWRDLDLIAQQRISGNSISRAIQDMIETTPRGVLIVTTALVVAPIFFLLGHLAWPQYRGMP